MKTDRSGRTLKDYRELFWEAEKRIRELEANEHVAEQALAEYGKQSDKITELEETIERVDVIVSRMEFMPQDTVYSRGTAYEFRCALDKHDE